MRKALADIGYVQTAGKAVRDLVIPAYVESFHSVNSKSYTTVRKVSSLQVRSIQHFMLATCGVRCGNYQRRQDRADEPVRCQSVRFVACSTSNGTSDLFDISHLAWPACVSNDCTKQLGSACR